MQALDEVFGLLGTERRRFALYHLSEADGKVSIEELAERIHDWEADESRAPTPEEYEDIVISLEHNHLPKIDDARYIEYDREHQQLRITGISPEVEVLLSVSKVLERPSETTDILDLNG